MHPDLEDLKITAREIENLSGFDVNEVFIGGVLGGVYRPSSLRRPKRLAFLCLTEIFVFVLTFIFSLPIGILAIRNSPHAISSLPEIFQFLQLTLGVTLAVILLWNVYMSLRIKRIKTLARLLDEIDKYNEVIQSLVLLNKLETVGNLSINLTSRDEVIEVLNVTRVTLVCALMAEKVLRENQALLTRRYDLLTNIENNLVTLRALEVRVQADEYGQILNNALQISLSVHKEILKLSYSSRLEL